MEPRFDESELKNGKKKKWTWRLPVSIKELNERLALVDEVLEDNETKITNNILKKKNIHLGESGKRAEEISFYATLERLGSYILGSKEAKAQEKDLDFTYHKFSDKLDKRLRREQMDAVTEHGVMGNVVDSDFAINELSAPDKNGAVYKGIEVTDEDLANPEYGGILQAYLDLYNHVDKHLHMKPDRLYRYYSNSKSSLNKDIQDVLAYHKKITLKNASISGNNQVKPNEYSLDIDISPEVALVLLDVDKSSFTQDTSMWYLYESFQDAIEKAKPELSGIDYLVLKGSQLRSELELASALSTVVGHRVTKREVSEYREEATKHISEWCKRNNW
jgi:hypothetical protein